MRTKKGSNLMAYNEQRNQERINNPNHGFNNHKFPTNKSRRDHIQKRISKQSHDSNVQVAVLD